MREEKLKREMEEGGRKRGGGGRRVFYWLSLSCNTISNRGRLVGPELGMKGPGEEQEPTVATQP